MRVTSRVGAFPAACVTALLALGCATAMPRSAAQQATDETLADTVSAALDADPVYFYRHVDVRVEDGVADLSGYVWSTPAIYRARQITLGVPGVRRVVTSQLELERQGFSNGRAR
jgi:osmotically-inducible protein OsmY